jgi:prolyl oligopeptidase PreP (S9A serine peptidase family)
MLYGYGVFKGNLTPFFFPSAILWAEAGAFSHRLISAVVANSG